MIQRIQTIFLFLASAAAFGALAFPFASHPDQVAGTVFADSVYNATDRISVLILLALTGILTFASILLFKNRRLQMRMTIIAFFVNLLAIIIGVVVFIQDSPQVDNDVLSVGMGLFLPVITFFFTLLAYRFIHLDEKKVRSMDRLR